uniref:Uncharacterized protein n=1 Tax=Rhizophora mucronata TaxID=61149 RepID=A0A2P2PPV2_RHIMU
MGFHNCLNFDNILCVMLFENMVKTLSASFSYRFSLPNFLFNLSILF